MISLILIYIGSFFLCYKKKDTLSLYNQICYHNFADKRGDVISNIGFVIVGIYHIVHFDAYIGAFSILVGIGSTYYHLNPTMDTLLWDRLPMVLEMAYILHSILDVNFWLVFILGLDVVLYWYYTMDLVPYAAYQMAPCILFMVYGEYGMRPAMFYYILAKMCENYDIRIFNYTKGIVSGHTLKHLYAAYAIYLTPTS